MKIFFSPYELQPFQSLNRSTTGRLSGFLIKIQTDDIMAGYADCLPWKIFGDEPVKVQLQRFKEGAMTPLLRRSLQLAVIDGLCREKNVSLFDKKIKVRSHYTCVDLVELTPSRLSQLADKGYRTIKVKVGRQPAREAKQWSSLPDAFFRKIKWRFDFNGRGGNIFLDKVDPKKRSAIEFVEDPLPFDINTWKELKKTFKVVPAVDHTENAEEGMLYSGPRIIKTARSDVRARKIDVITNSMDHPVGQSFAFWEAQRCVKRWGAQPRDFGLQTQHLFVQDKFFREISEKKSGRDSISSPYFKCSDGYGVGFDDLLESQKWNRLI